MLQKPGKDPSTPKGWRPIALLSCLGKVLEAIIAKKISAAATAHQLLPDNQMARPGCSTNMAIRYILETIQAAWKKGKVATVLLLDIAGAFNKVHHERLIHNLRERRIPK